MAECENKTSGYIKNEEVHMNSFFIKIEDQIEKYGLDSKTGKSIKPLDSMISFEEYGKFEEKMLTVFIQNEEYINGPASEWKRTILSWMNERFKEITWRVSVGDLIATLKEEGFTFNVNESLISPLIIKWLATFKEAVRKDLNLKVNMIIIE
ncbi:Uncharacterised protein [Sporosarcina pasteurii]|uniref:Uncharacterized protein n=2 Tax=Sporosarcina pasteurii TaxID=1474 RepID=A0A380BF37_SPOPA|nr:Uncharacterised protein [Sporosarcina pasteurii]